MNTTLKSLLATSLVCGCVGQLHAAGDAAATSGYATIQPNAANTGYVYTFSWVAPDTDNNSAGVTYTDTRFTNPAGNASANLDDINGTGGNYVAPGGQLIKYVWAGNNATNWESDQQPLNTATAVGYQGIMDYSVGVQAPSTATPKHDSVGNFTNMPSFYLGAGVQGVTGVYGAAPDGSDALAAGAPGAIHQGIGFGVDTDGANDPTGTDDFNPIIAGFDPILDATPTNTHPNTGYLRVEVPYGTAGDDFTTRFNPGTFTGNAAIEMVVTTQPEGTYNAKLAVSGDFDSDLDIDNADVGIATGNYTGSVGAAGGQWYANGDMDADGDVDNVDVGKVTGGFTGSLAGNLTPTVGVPDLIYDPTTGNMTVDTEGLAITSFQLENGAGTFADGNYLSPADFPNNLFGFSFAQLSGSVIGDSDGLNVGFTGTHDFGDILPTGLSQEDLEAYLSTAFWGTFGSGSGEFDLVVAAIPEPSIAGLLGLSVFGLLRRRRK